MKAPLRFAAKACLVTAASGLLGSQVTALQAQDGAAPAAQPSTGSKVVQAQGYAPVTATSSAQAAPDQNSAVQKELEKLYRKNNREMPSMSLSEAPNTQGPTQPSPQAAVTQTQPARMPSTYVPPAPKANWFERTFHVGRGKRKPASSMEYATQAQPGMPANRTQVPLAQARPMMPGNRAPIAAARDYQAPPSVAAPSFTPPPVVAGPAASAAPAQPQLREPSPLAPTTAARELTMQSQPPAVRPARPQSASQPMLDESGIGNDVESLDLDDDGPKVAEKAPQILSNPNDGKAVSDSPYSGLKIAPNEEERQASGRPQAATVVETADDDGAGKAAAKSPKAAVPAGKPASSKSAAAKSKAGLAPLDDDDDEDDDDDDDDDDEDMLSLPSAKSGAKPRTLSEPAVLKAAKVLEKMRAPTAAAKVAAAPAAAPAAQVESAPASPASAPVASAPATPATDAAPAAAPFSGLKGICPVALKDSRKLIDARPSIVSTYKGKTYAFSSVEAKQAFDENPQKYAPAGGGSDIVKLASGEKGIDGTLEHAAWYRGRLYLFSSAESRHAFVDAPSKFVIED